MDHHGKRQEFNDDSLTGGILRIRLIYAEYSIMEVLKTCGSRCYQHPPALAPDKEAASVISESTLARFWAKVDVRGPDECWPWRGATDPKGYGNCILLPGEY